MNKQLFFSFPDFTNYRCQDMIVGEFNRLAFDYLFHLDKWLMPVCYIYGDNKVGKTHLGQCFIRESFGFNVSLLNIYDLQQMENLVKRSVPLFVDDCHLIIKEAQVPLFNLYNLVIQYGTKMLLASNVPVAGLDITLPDLRSRFKSVMSISVSQPDIHLLKVLFVKLMTDHQIIISNSILDYLLKRIPRTSESIFLITQKIKEYTMVNNQAITLHSIKEIIED